MLPRKVSTPNFDHKTKQVDGADPPILTAAAVSAPQSFSDETGGMVGAGPSLVLLLLLFLLLISCFCPDSSPGSPFCS